ncbi:hypothetical protein K438DRAFT_1966474 [Mycena galopus ATCC 62051]|nr:hypothetical protein K438DRAFT_1966474 [Mycena galopus ATCC 62051]
MLAHTMCRRTTAKVIVAPTAEALDGRKASARCPARIIPLFSSPRPNSMSATAAPPLIGGAIFTLFSALPQLSAFSPRTHFAQGATRLH